MGRLTGHSLSEVSAQMEGLEPWGSLSGVITPGLALFDCPRSLTSRHDSGPGTLVPHSNFECSWSAIHRRSLRTGGLLTASMPASHMLTS